MIAPEKLLTPLSASAAVGVGHEVESLPDVRRPDARSAQIRSPKGVTRSFQVSAYSVEPLEAVMATNLLAKNDWRAAFLDELEPVRPEMPFVVDPATEAGVTERLTGARACPDFFVVRPAREPERVAPERDAAEKVCLRLPFEVFRLDLFDAPLIHDSWSDMPRCDQVASPLRWVGVVLVVEGGH
jgi:hypothetical protein